MHIHNFFSDVLLSVRVLFDKYIFPNEYIKSYQFNISNRTFQIANQNYKANYELPSAIISLGQDDYTFGERPSTVHQTALDNIHKIPVLYSEEDKRILYLQEEHTTINISVQINCESQLQAKDIEFTIKRYLPLMRYIQILNFTSFLEVSPQFVKSLGFEIDTGNIDNLFIRKNLEDCCLIHCFSMNYKPLIRLENSSVEFSDSGQQSFPVNLNLSYQIQMPMYLTGYKDVGYIEKISLDFMRFGSEPISENSVRQVFNPSITDKYGDLSKVTKRNLLIHDFDDYDFSIIDDKVLFNVILNKDDFVIKENYHFNIVDRFGKFHYDVEPVLISEESNQVNFIFDINTYNNSYKPSITQPIILQFVEFRE